MWWWLYRGNWSFIFTIIPTTLQRNIYTRWRMCLHHLTARRHFSVSVCSGVWSVGAWVLWPSWDQRWQFRRITFDWKVLWQKHPFLLPINPKQAMDQVEWHTIDLFFLEPARNWFWSSCPEEHFSWLNLHKTGNIVLWLTGPWSILRSIIFK